MTPSASFKIAKFEWQVKSSKTQGVYQYTCTVPENMHAARRDTQYKTPDLGRKKIESKDLKAKMGGKSVRTIVRLSSRILP